MFIIKDIFSLIPELRETYYLRYFEEPNVLNSFHLVLNEIMGYIWKDANYSDEKGKQVI